MWVLLASGFVVLSVIYGLAFQLYRPGGGSGRSRANEPLAFQVMFRDLPSKEQRVFRQMQEGVEEAMRLRAASGEWPTVESLAAMEIPPFTPDVLDTSSLAWSQQRDGPMIQYSGIPAPGTGMPSFLIFIQEPDRRGGEDPSTAGVDEEHRLLPDGKLLHVTFWKHPPPSPRASVMAVPALLGWVQIRVMSPLPPTEEP